MNIQKIGNIFTIQQVLKCFIIRAEHKSVLLYVSGFSRSIVCCQPFSPRGHNQYLFFAFSHIVK